MKSANSMRLHLRVTRTRLKDSKVGPIEREAGEMVIGVLEWILRPETPHPSSLMLDAYLADQEPTSQLLEKVRAEIDRARAKFPSSECKVTALIEEVGELAQAVLEKPWDEAVKEAVQVAAVALRVAEEGDVTQDAYREKLGLKPTGIPAQYAADIPF